MKTNRFITMWLLLCAFNGLTIVAQPVNDRLTNIEKTYPVIDDLFKKYAAENHYPGMAYGLVVDGVLVHTGAAGVLNTDQKNPVDSKAQFRIAAMTKSFTAMAILKLRDEGKLKLDDPVYEYIPAMKNQHYLTTDASPVTIRHLLTHAAGFPEDNPWGDRQLATSDSALLELIDKGISFSNIPGTSYEYSNLGFTILGYIIKKVSGKTYQQYISENILEPLGMQHTYWEYSSIPQNQLAHGYRWQNKQWIEQPMLHAGTYGAMGGMITSIEDFSKYIAWHKAAWPPRNDEDKGPVKRSSLREMQYPWNIRSFDAWHKYAGGRFCPWVTAYGYGLVWTKDCEGRVYISHSGGLPGFGSNWRMLPDYGIAIVSFGNVTYAPADRINVQVLDSIIAIAKLQPRQLPASEILNQRKKELFALLPDWKNAATTKIFADNFFLDYSQDALVKEAKTIFNRAGKIRSIKELVPENNLRGAFIIECENGNIEVSFTLTPENPPLIQEYHIRERTKN